MDSLRLIEGFFATLHAAGAVPLSAGGDHLVTLPIYRALARQRPVGMIHFDAHSDNNDRYFGEHMYDHAQPLPLAVGQGRLDPKRELPLGIPGSIHSPPNI